MATHIDLDELYKTTISKLQTESLIGKRTFGTLPFARHKTQRFAKVKEPNFPTHMIITGLKIQVK